MKERIKRYFSDSAYVQKVAVYIVSRLLIVAMFLIFLFVFKYVFF